MRALSQYLLFISCMSLGSTSVVSLTSLLIRLFQCDCPGIEGSRDASSSLWIASNRNSPTTDLSLSVLVDLSAQVLRLWNNKSSLGFRSGVQIPAEAPKTQKP